MSFDSCIRTGNTDSDYDNITIFNSDTNFIRFTGPSESSFKEFINRTEKCSLDSKKGKESFKKSIDELIVSMSLIKYNNLDEFNKSNGANFFDFGDHFIDRIKVSLNGKDVYIISYYKSSGNVYFEEDDGDEVNGFQKEFQLKGLDGYNNIETQMSLFFSEINQTIEQRDVSTNTQESQSIFLQTVENDRRVILENIIYFFEEYGFNTDGLIYEKKIYKHSDNIEKMIKFKSSGSIFFFVSVENDIGYKNGTIYYPLSNSENLSKIKENF